MLEARKHPNKLGLWGWLGGGRWGLNRYLYSLHRLTGLALLLYIVLHVVVTSTRALGRESWEQAMAGATGTLFAIGELVVFTAFVLHALNGIRLIVAELGFGVGRASEPVYPYETCLQAQRPWIIGVMILAALLVVVAGLDVFILH